MKPNRSRLAFALAACVLYALWALPAAAQGAAASPAPAASATRALSRGFGSITLGMPWQTAYDALKADTSIDYRGAPDVSMSPGREERIIETRGGRFIARGVFQFRADKLFTIILEMNPLQLDYYTLFTEFSTRYGAPASLDPRATVWEDASVRIVLERPCTVKYLDRPTLEAIEQQSTIKAAGQEDARAKFIDKL